MDIYAPLAARIGVNDIKDELEDLAFAEINPDARSSIKARLDYLRSEGGDLVERIIEELRGTLSEGGVEAQIAGRMKTPYSVWQKMQRKNVGIEQLSDIMAFRLVVADVAACYHAQIGRAHV